MRSANPSLAGVGLVSLVAALLAPARAHALAAPLCTTGPDAVACDWCRDPTHCHSAGSVGATSNGRVQHPEIVLLFWQDKDDAGYQWEPFSLYRNTPTQSQLIGDALGLVNSPYYASLYQYGSLITRPRLSPYAPIVTGPPDTSPANVTTTSFQDTDLEHLVDQAIDAGLAPAPAPEDDVMYLVFLPSGSPGTSTASNPGCYHDHRGCSYSWGSYRGVPYTFGYVVAGPDASDDLARETVDAIASFEDIRVDGCTYVSGGGAVEQVADLCRCATETWDSGLSLQAYWSVEDDACVLPETWGAITYHTLSSNQVWIETGSVPRQAYGGGHGVAYTDAHDDLFFYDSDSNVATPIGGPGAEFAVGTSSDGNRSAAVIAGVTLDTQYGVNYYDTGAAQWFPIGAPNGPVTSLTVTGQGIIVVTDTSAQPWYYIPANRPHGGWVNFGGPGDQFIAIGDDIYALNSARDAVFVWPWQDFGTRGLWSMIRAGTSYMQILGSPDADDWATSEAGEQYFWPSGSFLAQFVAGYDFAVSANPLATFVAGGLDVQGQASAGSGWSVLLPKPVGRLVSGNQVYATSCPGAFPCVILGN